MGLWATIESCEVDLAKSGYTWNYSIVCNGDKKLSPESSLLLTKLDKAKKVANVIITSDVYTPPEARQIASEHADGRLLAFFDNHCIVHKDYFARAYVDFETYDITLLHSTTKFFDDEPLCYHYLLDWKTTFWAHPCVWLGNPYKAYKIAAGGHGGFVVDREKWERFGGYGPKKLFVGYAGEELTTDLRLWMHGGSVWLDPQMIHTHYVGNRGYRRHYTDDFFTNLMASAYIIGGQQVMENVCLHFVNNSHSVTGTPMYDLMQNAYDRSKDYAAEVQAKSIMNFQELLRFFSTNCIPF